MKPETYILKLLIERMTLNPAGYWTVDKEQLTAIQSIPEHESLMHVKELSNGLYMIFTPQTWLLHRGHSKHKLAQEQMASISFAKREARETLMGFVRAKLASKGVTKKLTKELMILASDSLVTKDYMLYQRLKLVTKLRDYLITIKEIEEANTKSRTNEL